MHYFIFNFKEDYNFIESFLESSALAHNSSKRDKSWFYWKFRDNPNGECVLACVEDNNRIVGCVAFGFLNYSLRGSIVNGAISFETFVHPNYQGKGIFSNLIGIAEKELNNRNIDFLLNFPNSHSLKGFLKAGWNRLNIAEYWLKIERPIFVLTRIFDLKKSFSPSLVNSNDLNLPKNYTQNISDHMEMVIPLNYLIWRFSSYINGQYFFVEKDNFTFMVRLGKRGKITEAQILFVNIKNTKKFKILNLIKALREVVNFDIIGFPISKNNQLRSFLNKKLFFKVPHNTNVCYKIINKNLILHSDLEKMSLYAINYHTY